MDLPRLTEKEERIYGFIKSYFERKSRSPTYQEITEKFGYRHPSSIQDFITNLKAKGYIKIPIGENQKRAIELAQLNPRRSNSGIEELPLVGFVAAGSPIEAIENQNVIEVPKTMLKSGKHFALQVKGFSMIEDAITDGDIVVIKKQQTAENGQTVVALIDHEATIKRFQKKENKITLHPANPAFKVIHVREDQDFKIEGILVGVVRHLWTP